MTFTVIVPARLESSRLPGKALANLNGKPMIVHVLEQAAASGASRVVAATDSDQIIAAVTAAGFEAVHTGPCDNGSARVAAAVASLGIDGVVINLQGDLPAIDPNLITAVGQHVAKEGCSCCTAAALISDELAADPNVVKVVLDNNNRALFFSRAPIPYQRNKTNATANQRLGHIGIYAFAPGQITQIPQLTSCSLEHSESLEQLRWLWHGWRIDVIQTPTFHHGIDTPAELEVARRSFAAN